MNLSLISSTPSEAPMIFLKPSKSPFTSLASRLTNRTGNGTGPRSWGGACLRTHIRSAGLNSPNQVFLTCAFALCHLLFLKVRLRWASRRSDDNLRQPRARHSLAMKNCSTPGSRGKLGTESENKDCLTIDEDDDYAQLRTCTDDDDDDDWDDQLLARGSRLECFLCNPTPQTLNLKLL